MVYAAVSKTVGGKLRVGSNPTFGITLYMSMADSDKPRFAFAAADEGLEQG
jgi:hypothetical protein